jgi:hypothetical protein
MASAAVAVDFMDFTLGISAAVLLVRGTFTITAAMEQ